MSRVAKVHEDGPKRTLKQMIEPYIYLLPFAFGIVVFTLYPLINVVLMSFKNNYDFMTRSFSGWGIDNYLYVLNDSYFHQALGNTFKYVFIVIPISMCLSILLANLLNQKIKGSAIFQTAFFLPMVTSTTAVGLTWRFMFNNNNGIINGLLGLFGIAPINWLQIASNNFFALCVYGIWAILPFTIILLLSGLQNIDPLYYTAAKVDGASSTRIFFRITIPLLAPTIFLVMCINTISTFKVFNDLFPLFSGPGIANNLFTAVYYIYYQFRVTRPPRYGRAAAAAVILFLIIFVMTMIQKWVEKKTKY